MRRFVLFVALFVGLVFAMSAKDIYAHDGSVLPKSAQTIIANNFKSKVSVVKIDKDFGRISEYEVTLTDGTEISFDRNGNWKDVETNKSKSVPDGLIPQGIRSYVAKNHSGVHVVGIDKDRSGYDVELSNGIDIEFDVNGNFKRYD